MGALRNNRMALIGAVIAPVAFPWFAQTNAVVQFFAHTLFYGTVLGLLLEVTMIPTRRPRVR